MMKNKVTAIMAIFLIIGFILAAPVYGMRMPQLLTVEISQRYVKIKPAPKHVEISEVNNHTLYTFPDTFLDSSSTTNPSSITLIATYPITLITPTSYIATTTTDSLIIGDPLLLVNSSSNTQSSTESQTSTENQTSTQTITATPYIDIPQINEIPKQKLSSTFFFLSPHDLTKILLAYTRFHHIDTPTSTIQAIASSTSKWSRTFGIDPLLILAQIRWESKFKPYVRSKSDAKGLMQLKDFVYQPIASFLGLDTSTDAIFDIDNNIAAGTYYMYYKIRTWGTEKGALGAYLLGDTGLLNALWNETEGKDSIGTTYQMYIEKIIKTRDEIRSYIGLPPYHRKLSVYISPGHGTFDNGYYDMGAIVGKYHESTINLSIALKLKNILEENGIKVYMARTKERDPHTPYLSQRVKMINILHPNAVISIHANANPYSSSIRGYEIYYRKNYDRFFAKAVDRALSISSPIPKHRDPQYMKLIILSGWPPSILIETGYMTNQADLNMLLDQDYQWAIAHSIAKGVLTFLGQTEH